MSESTFLILANVAGGIGMVAHYVKLWARAQTGETLRQYFLTNLGGTVAALSGMIIIVSAAARAGAVAAIAGGGMAILAYMLGAFGTGFMADSVATSASRSVRR